MSNGGSTWALRHLTRTCTCICMYSNEASIECRRHIAVLCVHHLANHCGCHSGHGPWTSAKGELHGKTSNEQQLGSRDGRGDNNSNNGHRVDTEMRTDIGCIPQNPDLGCICLLLPWLVGNE
ncbi:hypothetical protein V8C42DRAFT_320846 [Trichoderma barbatum]